MKEIIECKDGKMKGKKEILCVCAPSAKESILKAIREMGYEDKVDVVSSEVDVKKCKPLDYMPLKNAIKRDIKTFEKYKMGATDERDSN